MNNVQVTLPAELLEASGVNPADASRESAKLLSLELFRENKVSLGRAAELCTMPIEAFMVFAGQHEAPMHYSASDLEEDRLTLERLNSRSSSQTPLLSSRLQGLAISNCCASSMEQGIRYDRHLLDQSLERLGHPKFKG